MFHYCGNITRSNLICSRCTFRAALINGCNSCTQIKLNKAATCRRKGKFHSVICGVCHHLRSCIFMKSECGRSGEGGKNAARLSCYCHFTTHASVLTKGERKAAQAFTPRLLTRVSIQFQEKKEIYVHTDSGTIK